MRKIVKIQKELKQLVEQDKNSWARFYTLMKKVEDEQLYKELNLNSFTAWVKKFAMDNKIHESVLWNKKKAGKVYERYVETKQKQGIEVAPIKEANVGVDSLVLLDKISKKNADLGAELTEKAINKEITRADLRNAYKTVRGDLKKDTGNKVIEKYKVLQENGNDDTIKAEPKEENTANVTATNIVMALNNHTWLGKKEEVTGFKGRFVERKYRALTEFPVYPGTTKKSRRIDVLVAENIKAKEHYNINLHGIEIKVAKWDFLNDTKYTEYAEFVDRLWIAIPESLLDVCTENTPKGVGILIFKDGKIEIKREAKKIKPDRKQEALTTLALKLL